MREKRKTENGLENIKILNESKFAFRCGMSQRFLNRCINNNSKIPPNRIPEIINGIDSVVKDLELTKKILDNKLKLSEIL